MSYPASCRSTLGAGRAALRTRRLRGGRGATFALGHVHDVVNTEPAHAVSVHAYLRR